MTDPNDSDNPWADLYKDLGIPASEPQSRPPELTRFAEDPPPLSNEPAGSFELIDERSESEDADDDLSDDEADGEAEPIGEGAPGDQEPKKRRRRRRRRKKKVDGPQVANGEAPTAAAPEPIPDEGDFEGDEEEPVLVDADGLEEVSPEMTRDLIANWNVPSWSEIVAGLYRPER